MSKRLTTILAVFTMFILFGSTVQAHSAMTSSDPEEGSTAEGEISTVSMTFDTDIEKEENVYLENEDGERIDGEEINVEGDTVEVSFSEPLNSGDYTAYWEVYGADGHLVDGEFEFSVGEGTEDEGAEEQAAEDNGNTDQNESKSETRDTNEEEAAGSGDGNSGGMSGSVISLIIGLAAVAIAAIIFFSRKRA